MGAVNYTKEQLRAIESRGKNLLVSAAAGSGKTAVLVERILRRVTDRDKPVDVDKLLVLTFTNAAAAQMREKIYTAIESLRAERPLDSNLAKQAALVHNAMITTIHGFCLSILKNHFNEAGLSTDFRIADEGESRLLKQDALTEVLEQAYEKNDPGFVRMAETLASGKTDRALEDIVLRLYEFSASSPDPDLWLEHCLSVYKDFTDEKKDLSELPILRELFEDIQRELSDIRESFERLKILTEEVCGLDIYTPTIEADLLVIEDISGSEDLSELMRRLREAAFVRFGTGGRKGEPKPEEADKKQLQESRDALREQVKQLRERAARFDIAENRRLTADCIPVVSELVALTRQFAVCFSQKKRDAGVIDYGDMEHLAIRVLRINDGSVAGEYRELYEEIYVDEYQDSNMVQETILKAVARENNLFMVGDVKQSIYGFRLARPDIFIQKYESYKSGEQGERIDLNRNFRSRTEVLNAVNEVFSAIMNKDSAGIEYNKEAELIPGAEGYEKREEESSPDRTELLLIQREESSVNEKELEAEVVSERIQELVLGYSVKDSNTGGTRKAQYKDIVILLRTAREWAETFSRVLQKNGIPVMITSRTGYFAAYEVAHLLDYLKVIDNPRQDIPLASALLGAFGKMTDGELASLRGQYKTDSLYDTVVQAADTNQKAEEFLSRLNYYRSKMGHTGVYELLQEIIETGYGRYVAAMENGRQRLANVNMLLQKAEDYGKTSYKGLFQFVRYIDMLKKYEVDYGESQIAEGDDAVRIMTIHNSKGLEFPVCFLAGLGKKYNFTDQRVGTILDAEYGIGMDRVDIERRTKAPVILKEAIIRKGLKELRAEEMRLLYVAMTRAKEKLILTGSVKDPEKILNSYTGLSNVSNFLELFVYANRIKPLREISIIPYTLKGIVQRGVETELNRNEAYLRLLEISEGKADYLNGDAADEELSDMVSSLRERLAFQYSEAEDEESPQKFSVTELKQRHLEQLLKENPEEGGETEELFPPPPEKEKYVPKFIRGVQTKAKTVSGNLHGSAVHRLFELWNYRVEASPESIQSFLRDSADRGRIEQELIDTVSERELLNFFQSDLAKRMQRADQEGKLYREQPFVIRLDGQLIQGIIDAFFIEEGEIVVVDYKTDRVNESMELVKRYELQLEYYARALRKLLGQPVKERIIYSTVLNRSIPL